MVVISRIDELGRLNRDLQVTVDTTAGHEYNYTRAATLKQAGKVWVGKRELPGLSVFYCEGENSFHSYSVYRHGIGISFDISQ